MSVKSLSCRECLHPMELLGLVARQLSKQRSRIRMCKYGCCRSTAANLMKAIVKAKGWARQRGLKLHVAAAQVTGPGHLESSAGVAIGVRSHVGMAPAPGLRQLALDVAAQTAAKEAGVTIQFLEARVVAVLINGLVRGGFYAVALYLEDGVGVGGRNEFLLQLVIAFITSCRSLWIVGGDWNLSPDTLRSTRFLGITDGKLFSPGAATCVSGVGNELDYRRSSRSWLFFCSVPT